ncbi:MAG: HEAT repeat domain-containing protein [Thermoanaerobaculia bacterium]
MDCRDAVRTREAVVLRLSAELGEAEAAWLSSHLSRCPACAEEELRLAAVWDRLGADAGAAPSPWFGARTEALLEAEVRRLAALAPPPAPVVSIRPARPAGARSLLRAAAFLLAAAGGWAIARYGPDVVRKPGSGAATIPVVSHRTVDVSDALPDLSMRPRLSNVAFRPADAAGKVGVTFDVTTRYTVTGRPDQKGIADLLVYMMSGAADTEGARGRAIEMASEVSKGPSAPSPDIVAALAETASHDRNPGVRKKAVEALAQMTPSSATRDALVAVLRSDESPAVRIRAVEGLARAAEALKDPATLDALRARAVDERENGYVRVQAAQALSKLEM